MEVKGSDGKYKVSNFGRIWNIIKDKECNYQINQYGYYNCSVVYLGKRVNMGVHRLVGLHFIPNPENKPTINHKIADKSNNKVDNLEWNTQAEQMEHVRVNRLNPQFTYCCIVDERDNIIDIFSSMKEGALKYNQDRGNISKCCRGVINSTNGYKFRIYEPNTKTYIPTDFDKGLIKAKGKFKKKIYCKITDKIYNTQSECAKDLQVSQNIISYILTGKKKNIYEINYI